MINIVLKGRIDSGNAAEKEAEIFEKIGPETDICIDAGELEYISSAGLRILMKIRKKTGARYSVINVSPQIYEIFDTTGFTELLNVKKRLRSMDVTGCEIIGQGFFGTVYRVDEDTIVKVYNSPDAISMIENEQRMAKLAFLKGIPTAISYDIVKVGESYGSVFEMLKSDTFNDLVKKEGADLEKITDEYIGFMKEVHKTQADEGSLPKARDIFLGYVDVIKDNLTDEQYEKLKELLMALPNDNHIVHGDFQMKNVMLYDGEPMLIDMDTLSAGQPIFDLQALYVTYRLFEEDEPENSMRFLGISNETAEFIWDRIMDNYFNKADSFDTLDKIKLVAYIRFLYIITTSALKEGELGKRRIEHTKEHIREVLGRVKSLEI